MAVGKKLRFEIFKRDGFTCQYCGRTPPDVVLNCDHVTPVSKGGTDDQENLITACFDCNSGKSNISLDQVIKPLAEQVEIAKERREQAVAYNEFLTSIRQEEDDAIERVGTYWYNSLATSDEDRNRWVFGPSRKQSIRTFLKSLVETEIIEAAELAIARKPATVEVDEDCWKYFCGVCWKKIRSRKAGH
jgi:hypothetical protein